MQLHNLVSKCIVKGKDIGVGNQVLENTYRLEESAEYGTSINEMCGKA